MAHFYGTIQGNKSEVLRRGTKKSGIVTHAASQQGAVRVKLYHAVDGTDMAFVELVPWEGPNRSANRVIYFGPVGGSDE